ncbi:hypothetical protein ACFV90_36935 [Streptomyces sp. NPDC059904]|uniref:hypothetical protein n=1 Tax=Streptomyces sp. NPDC059904 TaxID=3346996 RepID=UPI003667BAF7
MTTAIKTPPKHGERRCYLAGCRLPECRRANYHYMCRYRLDRARNQNRRVDSAPVVEHVRSLVDSGWSRSQIATAATCSERSVISLYHGYYATIRADLAARILAAQPRIDIVKGKSYVDATGTIRRVRALIAIGHPVARIAAAIGVHRTPLGKLITHGSERVTAQLARDVAGLYKRWAGQPGNNVRARNRAVAEGWHGPLAWDAIDDPNCRPDETVTELGFRERAVLRREEIIHFAWHGDTPEQIHARLHGEVSISTIRQIVQDWRTGQKRQRPNRVRPERQQKELAA